uniref:Uncharacterized protein n=1 Tax=viral metagenome TaxID=1070528 RepID=A0A6M3LTI7_9ZZZZ
MAIAATIKDGKLTITADLDGNSASKSGKSTIVATTGGFQSAGEFRYSLNVIRVKK